MIYIAIFFLAFWAGFSARRGSICLVRATHEIIERKPPKVMFFVMEAMAVALSITIPAMIFFPDQISLAPSYEVSRYLIIGTVFYGFGAAMNGSCALGTLNQLMNGKIEYMATIAGIAIGFIVFLHFNLIGTIQSLKKAGNADLNIWFFIPLMLLVWSVVIFKSRKFIKQSEESNLRKLRQYLKSPVARDFIGISIFGFCSGALYLLLGRSWDYTKFIMDVEENLKAGFLPDESSLPLLTTTMALMIGMAVAAILSKDFKFQSAPFKAFIKRFLAGSLMGFSVGFIPGGNDTLILHGVPGMAFHAFFGLMMIMMAIAIVMYVQKSISPDK